jgi:hypothetical protein
MSRHEVTSMSNIKPASCLIALALLGAAIDIAAAQKATKSRPAVESRQRNCYAEAERRYPDPTPNTARNRQMWVYACWQGVRP